MAIDNAELMRKCSPEHLRMSRARIKQDRNWEKESKTLVNMKRSKIRTMYISPKGQLYLGPTFPRGSYSQKKWMNY